MTDARDLATERRLANALYELVRHRASLSNAEQASAALRRRTLQLCREVRLAATQSRRRILDITRAARGDDKKAAPAAPRAVAPAHKAAPGLQPVRLRRVMNYIDASLAERLTVRRLAAVAGMGPSHFATLFKRSTGLAPHEAVLQCRIIRAQEMLTDDALTIAAIGCELGFSSQAHFTTMFRKRVGVAPGAWRHARRSHATAHGQASRRKNIHGFRKELGGN